MSTPSELGRAERAVVAAFLALGVASATWFVRVPDLRDRAGLDEGTLGLVLAANGDLADVHYPSEPSPATLLGRIQTDVSANRAPPGIDHLDTRPVIAPADRSIQIHACHGRARQVEVLRDAILHALADDPSLEPRDVIVMCPDIDTFAPLI